METTPQNLGGRESEVAPKTGNAPRCQAGTNPNEDPFATPPLNAQAEKRAHQQKTKTKQGKGKDNANQARLPIGHLPFTFIPLSSLRQGLVGNSNGTQPLPNLTQNPPNMAPKDYITMPIMPRHPFLPSDNGVVTKGDFKYTEYPQDIPHLYPQLGYNNLLHHQPEQTLQWESKKGNKVLIREFRAKFEANADIRRTTRDNIKETLTNFLNEKTNFVLSDPKINPLASRGRFDPPWHTLVYDLSDSQYEKLLAHPIIATPSCVIIISPLQQVIPTFLTGITGISCRGNSEEGRVIVTEAVRKGLLSNSPLANDLDQIVGTGTYQELVEGISVYFVNTSDACPSDGWWNVESSGMPRHITIDQYRAITDCIKTLTFPTDDNRDGIALKKTRECVNCKCITHSVQSCPLYHMPGWLGPLKEETSNEIPRGNHNRGRGPRG
jgi:hypothetical protein